MTDQKVAPEGPDALRRRLLDNADYMEGRHGGPPATIETDSDLWRTTIQLQRDAASALASPPEHDERTKISRASAQPAASGPTGSPRWQTRRRRAL